MITIRAFEFTHEDYQAMVAVHNAVWPEELTTLDYVKFRDEAWPAEYLLRRFAVEKDGTVVAMASFSETHWSYRPGKYAIDIKVHPNYQNQGIGSEIYEHLVTELAELPQPPTILTSMSQEDKAATLHFLEKRGFHTTMRFPGSTLNVNAFDPTPFAGAAHKMEARGVQIATLAELQQRDPDWQVHVWELDCTCTLDEPLPDTYTPPTLEQYIKEEFDTPGFMPGAFFIALDGDNYVGLSTLKKDLGNPQRLQTGFTAVRRAYRRFGIATALKLRTIAFAQAYGAAQIVTGNQEDNPMFQINLRLGFQPKPAKLTFTKDIPSHD